MEREQAKLKVTLSDRANLQPCESKYTDYKIEDNVLIIIY